MIHELNITVKEEDFITKYLQTFNGIWGLNKPEFKIVEYILKNKHIVTKTSYEIIALEIGNNPSSVKLSIKDLIRRGVLIEAGEGHIVNPKLFSGANKVIINFNIV